MGNDSRARREARRRSRPRPQAGTAQIDGLIEVAMRYAVSAPRIAGPRIDELNRAGAGAPTPDLDPAALVVAETLTRIGTAWEHGWQPHDLVHAARRRTSAPVARWLARAVLVESDRTGALQRAPRVWADQLRTMASDHDHGGGPPALLAPQGRAGTADWIVVLVALDLMRRLPRSQLLAPPPSQWGRPHPASAPSQHRGGAAHDKTLTRVRALLAKAESTEFAAEAEAFTAKAQEIMTRHAIDEALLSQQSGTGFDVRGIRVLIHHPYAIEKAGLLDVIARANRTKAVWNDFASCMTLVGVPTDLVQVEMLFTSTLVQATRAMTRAGQLGGGGGADRSVSFRKAFLNAYAVRIGERLAASSHDAVATYGAALVPVLQRRADAVEGEFDRLFPHVTTGARRARFDARGWQAGTDAADAAVLPAGAVEG